MLHFARLVTQKHGPTVTSSLLNRTRPQVNEVTSKPFSTLWSALERTNQLFSSCNQFLGLNNRITASKIHTHANEKLRKTGSSKLASSFTHNRNQPSSSSYTSSLKLYSSQKRHYQTQWDFRSAYEMVKQRGGLFDWRRPISIMIAANIGVYLMWNTVGATKDGHKWMTENFMVSATTWRNHPLSLFNSAFSHSGLLHLLFNMVAIGTIGSSLQTVMGPVGFIGLTVVSALVSSAAHLAYTSRRLPENWQPRNQYIPFYVLPDGTPILESQIEAYRRVHGQEAAAQKSYFMNSEDHVWQPGLGASGIASAYFGYSTVLWPRKQFSVLFWTTHASRLMTLFVAFSTISMVVSPDSQIGHAAHMGGLAVGVAAALLTRGRGLRT